MRRNQQQQADDARIETAGYDVKRAVIQITGPLIEPEFAPVPDITVETHKHPFLSWHGEYRRDAKGNIVPVRAATDRSADGCLNAFIRLVNAPNAQIVAFAKRWGALGIWPTIRVEQKANHGSVWMYEEPIAMWREVAQRTRGILLLAAMLSEMEEKGEEGNTVAERREAWASVVKLREISAWFRVRGYSDPSNYSMWSHDIGLQRELLERTVNEWLGQVWVSPQFHHKEGNRAAPCLSLDVNCFPESWDEQKLHEADKEWPEFKTNTTYEAWEEIQDFEVRSPNSYETIRLRPSRLFNVIVLELVTTLTSQGGVYRCDVCNIPFHPEHDRQMRGTRKRICSDDCRRKNNGQRVKLYQRERRKKLFDHREPF